MKDEKSRVTKEEQQEMEEKRVYTPPFSSLEDFDKFFFDEDAVLEL